MTSGITPVMRLVTAALTALCLLLCFPTQESRAAPKDWSLGVLMGNRAMGGGDPNGAHPGYGSKIFLVTPGGWDWGVHVAGVTVGKRARFKSGAYAGFGVSILSVNAYGIGTGLTTSVGYEVFCLGLCLVGELQQEALVNGKFTRTSPVFSTTWAVRLGLSLNL